MQRSLKFLALAAAVAASLLASRAGAATIYSNPYNGSGGKCNFNTSCAAVAKVNDYAAQKFTVSAATTAHSASFTIYNYSDTRPTAANWKILGVDSRGLPGVLLASGSGAPILSTENLSNGPRYTIDQHFFDLTSVSLAPGTYYLAVQAVTTTKQNYLSRGVQTFGAAETFDGGSTWALSYVGYPSVAVALYDRPVGGRTPSPSR
ncbi:MAG: hypothetical protein JWR21_4226 [Herminiimonas sp.]|nr:hypothetical protein [Herminiimonas sp.]MDB5855115.1 hypothetical protein [Herminiimonas sp.]